MFRVGFNGNGLENLGDLDDLNSHSVSALVNLTPSEVCHGILNTDSVSRLDDGIFLNNSDFGWIVEGSVLMWLILW